MTSGSATCTTLSRRTRSASMQPKPTDWISSAILVLAAGGWLVAVGATRAWVRPTSRPGLAGRLLEHCFKPSATSVKDWRQLRHLLVLRA